MSDEAFNGFRMFQFVTGEYIAVLVLNRVTQAQEIVPVIKGWEFDAGGACNHAGYVT